MADHILMVWHFTHHAYIRYKKTSSTTTQVWQDSNSYDEYKCWIYFWNVIVNQMTCDRWFSKNLHQQKLCLFYGLTFRVIIRRSIFKMESVLWWLNINITFYVVQLSIDNIIFYRKILHIDFTYHSFVYNRMSDFIYLETLQLYLF